MDTLKEGENMKDKYCLRDWMKDSKCERDGRKA